MNKGKPLERREENSSHSPTGEEAISGAWGSGSGFPGPGIKEDSQQSRKPRASHLLDSVILVILWIHFPLRQAARSWRGQGLQISPHVCISIALHKICLWLWNQTQLFLRRKRWFAPRSGTCPLWPMLLVVILSPGSRQSGCVWENPQKLQSCASSGGACAVRL